MQSIAHAWSPRRIFFIALILTLGFRFWFAAVLPFTGDEGYFIWWGQWPDWGYYDHPPMIGWWLAALLKFGHSEWWLRLPQILQPGLLAWVTACYLRPRGQAIAWGAALLVLLAPGNVWNVLITTDTPLVYFSVLSGYAWLMARRAEASDASPWRWYLLSGLGLLGAVLSKYFVALLGFAYLVDTLVRPGKRKFAGLLLVYAMTLPGLALMAWWNAGHCWTNIMFNFYNRNHRGNTGLSWQSPLEYAGMLLYLLTPICFWYLYRGRAAIRACFGRFEERALIVLGGVPLALFWGFSVIHSIGLHWMLSFLPFVLILLALSISEAQLRKTMRFFVGFAIFHVLLVVGIYNTPLERWKENKFYDGIVLTVKAQLLLDHLAQYSDYTWMMDGYSNAVTLGVNTYVRDPDGKPRYIGVFGIASGHARHDDILTDVRALDGGKIAILRKTAPDLDTEYRPYFRQIELKTFAVEGVTFYLILGQGFDYVRYRDAILAQVKQLYYAIPPALPQTACYFCDRYFPGQPCHR
ncbi:MAG TPA: glycosyltransferase family 39 protein [Rhodocyclaceae bacterium]|nr:glycosyltransferase family 39 protein [Rhodocyclaceae bacterium]